MAPETATRSMLPGISTVRPRESVNSAAFDSVLAAAADALSDPFELAAELEAEEPPQATSPSSAVQHNAMHTKTRILVDFISRILFFIGPSLVEQ